MVDHPEHNALYLSILLNPFDVVRKKVYADWLEENGYPQKANYIRKELEEPSGYKVMLLLETNVYVSSKETYGFVSGIICKEKAFLENAEELFSNYPITEVKLSDKAPAIELTDHYACTWVGTPNEDAPITNGGIPSIINGRIFSVLVNKSKFNHISYKTTVEAFTALSNACVILGRRMAGLEEKGGWMPVIT